MGCSIGIPIFTVSMVMGIFRGDNGRCGYSGKRKREEYHNFGNKHFAKHDLFLELTANVRKPGIYGQHFA